MATSRASAREKKEGLSWERKERKEADGEVESTMFHNRNTNRGLQEGVQL
jgi:hypothetical protein